MCAHRLHEIRWMWAAIFVVTLVSLAGCGPSVGEISGNVTYKNARLKSGTVLFTGASGTSQAVINADGSYTARDVPCGEVKVGVVCLNDQAAAAFVQAKVATGRSLGKANPAAGNQAPEELSQIPEEYGDVEKSQLRTVVNRGKNTYNIELK